MENGTWRLGLSTSSKYDYSDDFVDYEEHDEDYDVEVDYSCPFCTDDFDIVGLLCHIEEEHYDESKKGVCPVCDTIVGADLVEHIALQHENVYKSGRKSMQSDADSQSTIALIRKEMLERSLKSFLGSSSSVASSSNAAVDQLLTSFVCGYLTPAETETEPSTSLAGTSVIEEHTDEDLLERSMKSCVLSEQQEEQTQRSKFVQSILLSTFFDDGL
ncbi:protein DEHYDRATION-INDUCED 19 homolog 3-like [Silene latifolia]|uniref:protein DEHYDRATION-INDUCED 19 homolog 3-like n=1 Tax=Silene latifolia TaxID=37657 RepID=UPI003D77EE92